MQARDASTHNDAAGQNFDAVHLLPARHIERDRGREDSYQECRQKCWPVIHNGHWQVERQHPFELHRPDADAHRSGATA